MDRLLEEGHRYSFFQVVRLLQHAHPDRARVGGQGPVAGEVLRFRPSLDLAFAPSDVRRVRETRTPDGSARFEVTTNFFGLYGTVSPLPTYFTEELMAQEEDCLTRGLLDLFHHRLLSFFYRTWEKYRYSVQFDGAGVDGLSRKFLSLVGADRLPEGHRVAPVRLLGLAGILTRNPKSVGGLRGILNDYFEGFAFDVEACVPAWVTVPPDQRNRLAQSGCRLGKDLTLGERVLDRAGTFRVIARDLGLADFVRFLPGGDRLAELRELTDLFNTEGLSYEVELRLRGEEIPDLRLSSETARLGWSTWLGRGPSTDGRVRFFTEGWFHGRG